MSFSLPSQCLSCRFMVPGIRGELRTAAKRTTDNSRQLSVIIETSATLVLGCWGVALARVTYAGTPRQGRRLSVR